MNIGDLPEDKNRGVVITEGDESVRIARKIAEIETNKLILEALLCSMHGSTQTTEPQIEDPYSTIVKNFALNEYHMTEDIKSGKEKRRERRAQERKNKNK